MYLTPNETKAIVHIIWTLCISNGEDIIGVLMKMGTKKFLPDQELVDLAEQIEKANPDLFDGGCARTP